MNTIAAFVIAFSPVNTNAIHGAAVLSRQADARAAELADARMAETLSRLTRSARLAAPASALDHTATGDEQVGG